MDFLWIIDCFECGSSMFCLKFLPIFNFTNVFLSKTTFRSILYLRMVSCTTKKSLGPMDLNLIAQKKSHDCDLTADKVSRLSPKLSLRLTSLAIRTVGKFLPQIFRKSEVYKLEYLTGSNYSAEIILLLCCPFNKWYRLFTESLVRARAQRTER